MGILYTDLLMIVSADVELLFGREKRNIKDFSKLFFN
jgi:hypothetical protein